MIDNQFYLFSDPPLLSEDERKRRKIVDRSVQKVSLQLIYNQDSINNELMQSYGLIANQEHYDGIVDERSIDGRCGYPPCIQNLRKTSSSESKRQFAICSRQNALYKIVKKRLFCSGHCFAASEHFRNQLSTNSIYVIASSKRNGLEYPPQILDGNIKIPRRLTLGDELISKRMLFDSCSKRDFGTDPENISLYPPKNHSLVKKPDCQSSTVLETDDKDEVSEALRDLTISIHIWDDCVDRLFNEWMTFDSRILLRKWRWVCSSEYESKAISFLQGVQKDGHENESSRNERTEYAMINVQRSIHVVVCSTNRALLETTLMSSIRTLMETFRLTSTNIIFDNSSCWDRMTSLLIGLFLYYNNSTDLAKTDLNDLIQRSLIYYTEGPILIRFLLDNEHLD